MTKQHEEARPEPGAVLKTGGEDSASAYVASEVPPASDCPTIEVARVRLAPPSQTPTVNLVEVAKRPGPRAPDQMVKPTPKGPVELPEGRPVTKMQVIEIDSDFLIELAREREAKEARRAAGGEVEEGAEGAEGAGAEGAEGAEGVESAEGGGGRVESPWVKEAAGTVGPAGAVELPSSGGPPAVPVRAGEETRTRRGGIVMAVAVGVMVAAGMIAAIGTDRGPAVEPTPRAGVSTMATVVQDARVVPSVTGVPSVTVPVEPAPTRATTTPTAVPSPSSRLSGVLRHDGHDACDAAATPSPPKTSAPALTSAPSVAPTATSAPIAPPPDTRSVPPNDPKALQPEIKF